MKLGLVLLLFKLLECGLEGSVKFLSHRLVLPFHGAIRIKDGGVRHTFVIDREPTGLPHHDRGMDPRESLQYIGVFILVLAMNENDQEFGFVALRLLGKTGQVFEACFAVLNVDAEFFHYDHVANELRLIEDGSCITFQRLAEVDGGDGVGGIVCGVNNDLSFRKDGKEKRAQEGKGKLFHSGLGKEMAMR